MNKLTAEKCRKEIEWVKSSREEGMVTELTLLLLQALEIALPVLEQQEFMRVPAYYIVYHPNPDPHEYDDKEHSHCGSIHLARRLAGEIGGSICPVYIGDKLEQQERGEGGWIELGEGAIPVHPETVVEIKMRNGVTDGPRKAGGFFWFKGNAVRDEMDCDIIAYRIIPEQPTNQNGEQ